VMGSLQVGHGALSQKRVRAHAAGEEMAASREDDVARIFKAQRAERGILQFVLQLRHSLLRFGLDLDSTCIPVGE